MKRLWMRQSLNMKNKYRKKQIFGNKNLRKMNKYITHPLMTWRNWIIVKYQKWKENSNLKSLALSPSLKKRKNFITHPNSQPRICNLISISKFTTSKEKLLIFKTFSTNKKLQTNNFDSISLIYRLKFLIYKMKTRPN